jgi:ubiquinone/menaquinone biosynthesis C-methylase UbiE
LALANDRFPEQAEFVHFDGVTIPYREDSFDIAFAACVFHHIAPALHLNLLFEIQRVLKPGGLLFVFEHNPLNPLTVHAVNTCVFDVNARLIPGNQMRLHLRKLQFQAVALRYRIFFPKFLAWLRGLESYLTWLPLGAQYYIVARKA